VSDHLIALHYVVLVIRQVGAVVTVMVVIGVGCGSGSVTSESLRMGRGVYADNCSSCHGSSGQGGVGPSLANVLETWPDCADQQDWITLGSERWKAERGPTYGANDKPVAKVMPEHAKSLTPDEIAAVAAFERVQYGGGDEATESAACGLPDD
jgi:mono/diheme cytochrome c family protein